MIKEYRIENLRSLEDTGYIPIRPITILIGRNSSGKSTFLRSFPLFTQSVSKQLRNAMAWFDTNLVDFGDFSTAKSIFSDNDTISFSFKIDHIKLERWYEENMNIVKWSYLRIRPHKLFRNSEIIVSYGLKSVEKADMVSKVIFQLEFDNYISFDFKEKGQVEVTVNNSPWNLSEINWTNSEAGMFLPLLFSPSRGRYAGLFPIFHLMDEAVRPLRNCCNAHTSHFEGLRGIINLWRLDKEECLRNFKRFKVYRTLQKKMEDWSVSNHTFLEVYNNILGLGMITFWNDLSGIFGNYFTNCEYVAPLRAEANRYYRNQGLQVKRIDAYGRNLSEFISSLTPTQKDSYDEFIQRNLNVKVNVRNAGGHQSITLIPLNKEDGSEIKSMESNMTDTGFGYSQILPILTKLWHMQERTRFNALAFYGAPIATALIEQPELHLHPALQALLADVFVKTATNQEASSIVIVETHSPTIINRIGRRIREGHIDQNMASVVLFEKGDDGRSKVKATSFDKEGRLINWPYGFFEPENNIF